MSGPAIASIGTIFAGGAAKAGVAAAAGGLFAGGGMVSVLGAVASGIGQGLMARADRRHAEKMEERRNQHRIDEERRAEGSYAGTGDAMRFWERAEPKGLGVGAEEDNTAPVGQQERVGDQYGQNVGGTQPGEQPQPGQVQNAPARPPTYSFDRNTGRLVTS